MGFFIASLLKLLNKEKERRHRIQLNNSGEILAETYAE
jgi:hypothetical protein